jgi:RNA polymerase sigma factor (sigma-70 family)
MSRIMRGGLQTGAPLAACASMGGEPLRLLSDEQLAKRIAAGNQDAFTVVYDRHLAALTRYCRSILRVSEDAEDAAQNAMVAALRSLPGRPPQLKLRAWLFRVAHNEAISLIRRRRPHASLEYAADHSSLDVAETAAVRAELRQLLSDLHALPERQRTALVLRELSGLGYDEIAGVLGCSETTAMQTIFEARSALTQFKDGRSMSCTAIQRMISGGDRRKLRARRIRAHMRSCDLCRTFAFSLESRRSHLALLVPAAATNGGLAALLRAAGVLGGGNRARLEAAFLRVRGATPSIRGVAASVLVGAGGVTTAALYHDAHLSHRAHLSHHAHAIAEAPRSRLMQTRDANATRSRESARSSSSHVVAIPRPVRRRPASAGNVPVRLPVSPGIHLTETPSSQPTAGGGPSGSPSPSSGAGASGGTNTASGGIRVGVGSTGVRLSVGTSTGVRVSVGSNRVGVTASVGSAGTPTTVAATVKISLLGCLLLCH